MNAAAVPNATPIPNATTTPSRLDRPNAAELGWRDFAQRMETDDLIIVPLGMTEEHGLHNPLGTDTIIAEYCATEIARRTGALAAPVFPYGYGPEGRRFAGQLPISSQTLRRIWYAYGSSYVRHGAHRFLFVNGHGGNAKVLSMVMSDLNLQLGAICSSTEWWTLVPQLRPDLPCNDHGGKFETSCLLAIRPELVDLSRAEAAVPDVKLGEDLSVGYSFNYREQPLYATIDDYAFGQVGNLGASPLEASVEIGREVLKTYIDFNVTLCEELRKL
jgi:creatinine amidohydrolase